MRQSVEYVCDYCGMKFANEDRCAKHEAAHKKPVGFDKLHWFPRSDATIYPVAIDVLMEDGHVIHCTFQEVAK